jgi:hypothetical protein
MSCLFFIMCSCCQPDRCVQRSCLLGAPDEDALGHRSSLMRRNTPDDDDRAKKVRGVSRPRRHIPCALLPSEVSAAPDDSAAHVPDALITRPRQSHLHPSALLITVPVVVVGYVPQMMWSTYHLHSSLRPLTAKYGKERLEAPCGWRLRAVGGARPCGRPFYGLIEAFPSR